jgi:SAM-dependent methyltransferase
MVIMIPYYCEAEVAFGLEEIVHSELRLTLHRRFRLLQPIREGSGFIAFECHGVLTDLLKIRTALAIHLVQRFPIPRPKALLGHQHFQALLRQINAVLDLWQHGVFQTLYLSAAGSESSVMNRLKDELSQHTGLKVASHEGDLLLRVRRSRFERDTTRSQGEEIGWEALVRLSPRPLSTRSWRVCNFEGALNATVASAICLLSEPRPQDIFLNLACGSGSIMIERMAYGPALRIIGLDLDPQALTCTRANLAASEHRLPRVGLVLADACDIPLPDHSVPVLCADLPFGHLVGSHAENVELYPCIFREAARVAQPGARFILITHEVRLTEALLKASSEWKVEKQIRVSLGGLNPHIFALHRT